MDLNIFLLDIIVHIFYHQDDIHYDSLSIDIRIIHNMFNIFDYICDISPNKALIKLSNNFVGIN